MAVSLTAPVDTIIGSTIGPLLVATLTGHVYRHPALAGYPIAQRARAPARR